MALVVKKTKKVVPPRIVLYGEAGIGKSTFGALAGNSIFINIEDGLDSLDAVALPVQLKKDEQAEEDLRTVPKSFEEVKEQLKALIYDEHDFETLVIDSLSKLELLIWEKLCHDFHVTNIEKVDGGYGKGYTHALNLWNELLEIIDYLRKERNMTIILLAHHGIQNTQNPETQTYDTIVPQLNKKAVELIVRWADCVFYAHKQILVRELEEGFGNKRAIALNKGNDVRIMRTVGNAAVVAKNRYNLPEFLPLDYEAFKTELNKFYNN